MKKLLLLFTVMVLLPLSSGLSQTLMDYISAQNGDSLVIKDDIEYGSNNTLYSVINLDINSVPAGRVYVLKSGGVYSLVNNPTTTADQKTIIMGENQGSIKTRLGDPPPIVCGVTAEGIDATGGITSGSDLLVKNIDCEEGNPGGTLGWGFFGFQGPGQRLQVDNCIIEHNRWTVIGGPPANSRIFLTNNYFVNFTGHECRRNGGVLDFFSDQDTVFVENCTHVNIQGSVYKSRTGYTVNRQFFNHNDFIDCVGYVFMNTGDHANYSVTNSIFVNCNLQGFSTVLAIKDVGEVDPDNLPMGLVNVLVDSAFTANGASFYVDRNLVYWDPSFNDYVATLNANNVNGRSDWVSQRITMNTRTQALFDDDTNYPKLTEGTWIKDKLPNFSDTDVLFTDQLAKIKAWALLTVDTTYTVGLTSWRQSGNDELTYFIYADWPIPIDLSYTDADLMIAGLNGYPLGDLNWFPTQYESWKAQEADELLLIHNTLNQITAVKEMPGLPAQYELSQNYPNPFNPSTVINFTIPQPGNVTLKVYNSVGQEVATLLNEYKNAANYEVNFNASNLASGVYFYKLKVDNFTQTRKMLLIK